MDWTKIKTRHFLYSDLDLRQCGALAKLFCLTAHLERIPTESEMLRHVSKGMLKGVREVLEGGQTTLREVLDKVYEDVEQVVLVREKEKIRKRNQRSQANVPLDTSNVDKIREDKIREDKNKKQVKKNDENLDPIMDFWNECADRNGLPLIKTITKTRLEKIKRRVKDGGFEFKEITEKIDNAEFGTNRSDNKFRFSFDWILEPKNYTKILEGNYNNDNASKDRTPTGISREELEDGWEDRPDEPVFK